MPVLKPHPGALVVFEGPDGGGKSTQAFRLRAHLSSRRTDVVMVREPGGTSLGEQVRQILLDPSIDDMSLSSEFFLFMAARAQLVHEVVRPALARGAVVLCDRYLLSTLVYQGVVGGMDMDAVRTVGGLATGDLAPDITFLLDVPALVGLDRVGREQDRFEKRGLDYYSRIRQAYLDLARNDPDVVVLDATESQNRVADRIWEAVQDVLP